MKLKEYLYKTPEMTEEKLLKLMEENISVVKKPLKERVRYLHKEIPLIKAFLKEFDLIQEKKSYLTRSQRTQVNGFVGMCLIMMTKNGGESESND